MKRTFVGLLVLMSAVFYRRLRARSWRKIFSRSRIFRTFSSGRGQGALYEEHARTARRLRSMSVIGKETVDGQEAFGLRSVTRRRVRMLFLFESARD